MGEASGTLSMVRLFAGKHSARMASSGTMSSRIDCASPIARSFDYKTCPRLVSLQLLDVKEKDRRVLAKIPNSLVPRPLPVSTIPIWLCWCSEVCKLRAVLIVLMVLLLLPRHWGVLQAVGSRLDIVRWGRSGQ